MYGGYVMDCPRICQELYENPHEPIQSPRRNLIQEVSKCEAELQICIIYVYKLSKNLTLGKERRRKMRSRKWLKRR
jgi:hypothetical protein